ncbi:MAG: glutamine amidotransferase, partial [Chloroflexota bacterium]
MAEFKLMLYHLYPDLMNIYGDRGNIISIVQRCSWRGIEVEVVPVGIGHPIDPERCDLIFFGGGQDKEQLIVAEDLRTVQASTIRQYVESGGVLLS